MISILLLFYLDKKNFLINLGKSLFYGGIATVSAVVVLFLAALNFDWLFTVFHSLFFRTQWQFPADYLLIQLFPQQFFVSKFLGILLYSLIGGAVVGISGYFIEKYINKPRKK
jgi:uncharacterized membrane protein